MNTATAAWRRLGYALSLGTMLATGGARAAPDLQDAALRFQYNIEKVDVRALGTTPMSYEITAVFSATDPLMGDQPWDIKHAAAFQSAGAQLTIDIGWNPASDFTNTGGQTGSLAPLTALGDAAAYPVRITGLTSRVLTTAAECSEAECGPTGPNRYFAKATVTPLAFGTSVTAGRIALEGHPVCSGELAGFPPDFCPDAAPFPSIPVRSEAADFSLAPTMPFAALIPDTRRPIVDINKCKTCHDGTDHGTGVVPRLNLHGANRNENLGVCVICHNPNQTDVPYRRAASATEDPEISGPEVPVDFKVMLHAIHAGGFRTQPFVVVGFRSSINDFSGVRFPRELRDCTNCHIDAGGEGTFELPLRAGVLGTTIKTQSSYLGATRSIDVDPSNDVKISPTAAVCSSCHDKTEVKSHMVSKGGASFATTQAAIGTTVLERCANCHGPGKEKDVRKAHEIRGGGGEEHHEEERHEEEDRHDD